MSPSSFHSEQKKGSLKISSNNSNLGSSHSKISIKVWQIKKKQQIKLKKVGHKITLITPNYWKGIRSSRIIQYRKLIGNWLDCQKPSMGWKCLAVDRLGIGWKYIGLQQLGLGIRC